MANYASQAKGEIPVNDAKSVIISDGCDDRPDKRRDFNEPPVQSKKSFPNSRGLPSPRGRDRSVPFNGKFSY